MFSCTRTETRLIMESKAAGVVRRYPVGKCPHKPGSQLVFTSPFFPGKEGKEFPFARATITSVRPGTVKQFRKDKMLPRMDGFANGAVWEGHLQQFYHGIGDDASVYHVSFKIDNIDDGKTKESSEE